MAGSGEQGHQPEADVASLAPFGSSSRGRLEWPPDSAMRLDIIRFHTVMIARMRLPLHIFEPRYWVMIRVCIDGERPFVVTLIHSGEEVGGAAAPRVVGAAARTRRLN